MATGAEGPERRKRELARTEHRFEMALTQAEFERLLPTALGVPHCTLENNRADGASADVAWSLCIARGTDRRIGQLTLPTLHVTLACTAESERASERFVERFLLAYRRAGG